MSTRGAAITRRIKGEMAWIVVAVGSEQGTGVDLFAGEAAFQHRGSIVNGNAVFVSQGNMKHPDVAPCHMRVCTNAVLDLFPDNFKRGQESADLGSLPTHEERPGSKRDGCVKMYHRVLRSKPCQSFTRDFDAAG